VATYGQTAQPRAPLYGTAMAPPVAPPPWLPPDVEADPDSFARLLASGVLNGQWRSFSATSPPPPPPRLVLPTVGSAPDTHAVLAASGALLGQSTNGHATSPPPPPPPLVPPQIATAPDVIATIAANSSLAGSARAYSAQDQPWVGPVAGTIAAVEPPPWSLFEGSARTRSTFTGGQSYVATTAGGMALGGTAGTASIVFQPAASGGLSYGGQSLWHSIVYHVYANTGAGDPINYQAPVAATTGLTWTSSALAYPGTWKFGVRAYDAGTGYEETNVDAIVTVVLSSTGTDITALPPPPSGLTATPLASGTIRVAWQFQPIVNRQNPTGFHVYDGTGSVSYTTPVATIGYTGPGSYSANITGLTNGTTYLFAVRAYNATAEEANTATVAAVATAAGPGTVDALTIVATNVG